MYLSKLEIVGFKSFAQKTNFKFQGGITALVGPNGCGKTNIVDAIRWVLGEQKSAILRSEVMEDVIFNGSGNRKPLGMSEVSLTLENNKNILPVEYDEVTISRQLFRNGESHYLLNNTQCRLRDIVDLFMDTGMGADSYSVIELKMVEAILSGKPEERRHLMEEAAGVKKYKARRKEAGKKLAAVQIDLQRIQDILNEVDKNVSSLSRQAAKTKRYNKLQAELRELELEIIKHEYFEIKQDIQNQSSGLSEFATKKAVQEKEIIDSEASLFSLEQQFHSVDEEHRKAMESENQLNNIIGQKTRDIAVSQERVISLKKDQERIKNEKADSAENRDKAANNLEILKIRQIELNEEILKAGKTFSGQSELVDEAGQKVFALREALNSINKDLINVENDINTRKNNLKKNDVRKSSLNQRIETSLKEIENINSDISSSDSQTNELGVLSETLENKKKDAEQELLKAQKRQSQIQTALEKLQNEISDCKIEKASKNSQLEFLSSLVEGDDSTKYLIANKDWQPKSEKILLAEAVGTDDEYRVAVDAALGEVSKYFIVNDRDEALQAIQRLNDNEKGKATFICRDKVKECQKPKDLETSEEVIGWLSELVRVDETLRFCLRQLLGKTALVDNFNKAVEIVDNGKADCCVTLKGELVRNNSIIRGGSVLKKEGLTVGKKERTEKLSKEIIRLNKKLDELEGSYSENKDELSKINIKELTQNIRNAENELNSNNQKITHQKFKKESLKNNLSLIEQNLQRHSEELYEIDQENKDNDSVIAELEINKKEISQGLEALKGSLNEAEIDLSSKRENARQFEMQVVKLKSEYGSVEREIESTNNQINSFFAKLKSLDDYFSRNEISIEDLVVSLDKFEADLTGLKEQDEDAKTKTEFLADKKHGFEEQIKQYTADLSQKRKELEKLVQNLHQVELKTQELSTRLNDISERSIDIYEFNPEVETYEVDPAFSVQEKKISISSLKDRLSALGNVNFMALEEYDKESARLELYKSQVKDLTDSEKTLQETITEINQIAEERFTKTFEDVNANLKKLFKTLFGPEGEAELKLNNDNPLEADIEIIAKPPGKKPHSIAMLSGGEKTLTSIALLFAIYLVKPSPFCILDEVDAPLDDSNIDHFLSMIRDFSYNTQFMIVTHNKRTMEFADTLYGITMEEEGVSKVVSVRLSQQNGN